MISITVLSTILTFLVGLLDHITGYELSFSIFYIAPIASASWYGGRHPGLFLSVLSAFTWLAADFASGHVYSHQIIPIWNGLVRLAFFLLISHLLVRIKTILKIQQEMAETDGLTGLLNGRAFRAEASKILEFCKRINRPITLAYLDLDNFKTVNDTSGHSEGDRVLKTIGSCILHSVRSTDIVGRMGGDEFALTLPDTNTEQARTVIEKMHLRLKKEVGQHGWPIGFSIGVISFASPPDSAEDAIRHADNLMYRVKKAGKNNIFYAEHPDLPLPFQEA